MVSGFETAFISRYIRNWSIYLPAFKTKIVHKRKYHSSISDGAVTKIVGYLQVESVMDLKKLCRL